MKRAPCRRRIGGAVPRGENFGDLIKADHKILQGCHSRHTPSIRWESTRQSYPCKTKISEETEKRLQNWSRRGNLKSLHKRFPRIWQILWRSLLESLHVNTTQITNTWDCWDSRAQSKRRDICCIVAIGSTWKLVGRFYGMLWLSSKHWIYYLMGRPIWETFWRTIWRTNHSVWFMVEHYLASAKDPSRIHQFGKKVLLGLFFGYALYTGGIWKGDVLIADLEELETMDASEIYSKRLNAKEVIFHKQGESIYFSSLKRNEQYQRTGRPVLDSSNSTIGLFQDIESPKSSSILRKSSDIRKPIQCVKFTKVETKIHHLQWFALVIFISVTQCSKIWSVSGRHRMARTRCPWSSLEAGQKYLESEREKWRSILLTFGKWVLSCAINS